MASVFNAIHKDAGSVVAGLRPECLQAIFFDHPGSFRGLTFSCQVGHLLVSVSKHGPVANLCFFFCFCFGMAKVPRSGHLGFEVTDVMADVTSMSWNLPEWQAGVWRARRGENRPANYPGVSMTLQKWFKDPTSLGTDPQFFKGHGDFRQLTCVLLSRFWKNVRPNRTMNQGFNIPGTTGSAQAVLWRPQQVRLL